MTDEPLKPSYGLRAYEPQSTMAEERFRGRQHSYEPAQTERDIGQQLLRQAGDSQPEQHSDSSRQDNGAHFQDEGLALIAATPTPVSIQLMIDLGLKPCESGFNFIILHGS